MRCSRFDNLNSTRSLMRRPGRSSGWTGGAPSARRGAVLIMVVAVLGILFVSGAALLTVVTFSSRSLDAARIERENREAVMTFDRLVGKILAESFLDAGGNPLAIPSTQVMHKLGQPGVPCDVPVDGADDDCVLTLPTTGEVPGLHLLDLNEPLEAFNPDDSVINSEYRFTSNVRAMLERRTVHTPAIAANSNVTGDPKELYKVFTIYANKPQARRSGLVYTQGAIPFVRDKDDDGSPPMFYNDADGDGVLDAIEMVIPPGLLPANLQRSLASRLRATNYPGDPDELTITLRVVPHGAMVNLNSSHKFSKLIALGHYDTTTTQPITSQVGALDLLLTGMPYLPAANEWYLRNRGVLLPLGVQPTRLMENLASELLGPQIMGAAGAALYSSGLDEAMLTSDPSLRHWWRYDPVADTATATAAWRTLLNPANLGSGTFDLTHNLTTVGHDDLLMPAIDPADGNGDFVTKVKYHDITNGSDDFALDNYPQFLDGKDDPRRGRLKISLPYLDEYAKDPLVTPERFVRTIQDAFLAMLASRADFNVDGNVDAADQKAKAVQAAMLTANLIDYADNDSDNALTVVPVVDFNGQKVPGTDPNEQLLAFGYECQPFITEVTLVLNPGVPSGGRTTGQEGSAVFAVELYNPCDRAIDLSAYELTDLRAPQNAQTIVISEVTGLELPRLDYEELPSQQLPNTGAVDVMPLDDPARFRTVCSGYGANCPDNGGNSGGIQLGQTFGIDEESVMALVRPVSITTASGPKTVRIVVDQMELNGLNVTPDPAGAQPQSTVDLFNQLGTPTVISVQRDTTPNNWRFTVPRAIRLWGLGEQTPGVTNHAKSVQPDIYPVHLDLANSGSFASAFPTTGAMLLLGRMAHIYDPVASGDPTAPLTRPFNRVHENLLGTTPDNRPRNILGQYDQIDNGRLPLFDARPETVRIGSGDKAVARERIVSLNPTVGASEGFDALPWGQLVFEYFTAIPFYPCPDTNNWTDVTCGREYPKVDQDGLRVHGRININASPWTVLATLPMRDVTEFPARYQTDLANALGAGRYTLGEDLAKGIVAYREGRAPWQSITIDTGPYDVDRNPCGDGTNNDDYRPRRGFGFLTVGELANVRHPETNDADVRMDAGAVDPDVTPADPRGRYECAVANLVALDDWVTTRSHVFTVYGVIRGAHWPLSDPTGGVSAEPTNAVKLSSFREADQKAIRFQTTIDRLPMLFGADQPARIGNLVLSGYADERSE